MDCARTVDVLALSNRLNRPLCSPRQQLARHVARARVPGRPGDGFDALGRGAGARGRSERDRSCRRRSRACVSGVPSLQPLLCVRVTDVTSTIWGSCFRYFAARDAWRQRSWPVMCHDDAGGPLRRGGLEPLQSLQRWLGTVTTVTAMAWNRGVKDPPNPSPLRSHGRLPTPPSRAADRYIRYIRYVNLSSAFARRKSSARCCFRYTNTRGARHR